jgi:hypothetical protein
MRNFFYYPPLYFDCFWASPTSEVDDFVSFLLTLANRKTGEYSTLEHGGEY